MKIKYKNLETSVNIELEDMNVVKNLAGSLVRNANIQADESLLYNEIIDDSLIEYLAETPEEHIFLLNDALSTNKPLTTNEENKLVARRKIAEEVGDIYDIVADVSKRLTMMERLTVRLTHDIITNAPEHVPIVKAAYGDFIANYLSMQEAYSDVTAIADLEDPSTLFAKLFERSIITTNIIKTEYIDKKEP